MITSLDQLMPVINTKRLSANSILIYLWCLYLANGNGSGSWVLDYPVLTTMTGLPLKKISMSLAELEKQDLMDILRNNGRVILEPLEIPECFQDWYDTNLSTIQEQVELKGLQKKHFKKQSP